MGNAGPILYLDFLIPLVLIGLYIAYRRIAQDAADVVRIRPLSERRARG